ncbi:MAG: hypothetical protein K0S97_2313, partial [Chloroflexota bacterium]|nr:hypothetical protein [Chloroflexota bacterium]
LFAYPENVEVLAAAHLRTQDPQ